jgi:glycosyltransferase involved in cell wall biosynthesis
MHPKISLITISYNSEKTISRTIESVLTQSYENIEYVLIDGASTDRTNDIINSYKVKFKARECELIHISEPDDGISDAFNRGIDLASGEIIGIINSDDCLAENALSIVATSFNADIDVLYGNCLWVDDENHTVYVRKSKINIKELRRNMVIMHPASYVRKRAYLQYGNFNVSYKYTMDKELMTRFYQKGAHFKYVDEVLAVFYAGGVSDVNCKRVFSEGMKIAIDYGVPKWKAYISYNLKYFRMKLVNSGKKLPLLWRVIKKNE